MGHYFLDIQYVKFNYVVFLRIRNSVIDVEMYSGGQVSVEMYSGGQASVEMYSILSIFAFNSFKRSYWPSLRITLIFKDCLAILVYMFFLLL